MAARTTKASDFTGRQREMAAEAAREELLARKDQIAMAQQLEMELIETDVFDPSSGSSLGKLEQVEMEVSSPTGSAQKKVIIRVVEDIENMTFGVGTNYTFKAGQKYQVTKEIADHLESCGYLLGRM